MKSKVLLLSKVQFMEQLRVGGLKGKGSKKKRIHFWLMAGAFTLLALIASFYFYTVSVGFVYLGLWDVLPGYGLALSAIITIFFTVLKTNGVLLNVKDYETLMSLPVKTSTVISSRFLTMYIMNLCGTLLVLLPMGIALVQYEMISFAHSLFWLGGALFAPLFPTTIASFIGTFIAWIASKFRHSNTIVSVLSIFLILVFVMFSFSFREVSDSSIAIDSITALGKQLGDSINGIYPLAAFFSKAVLENNLLSFLLFAGLSIGWYELFLMLLSKRYKRICTALFTHRLLANYRITTLKKNSQLKALYKKDLKRFFSTSIYLINVGVGAFMLLIFSIGTLFLSPQAIESIISSLGAGSANTIEHILPFVVCAMLGMSCTTCVSLSLEGKNIWILKSLPISPITIFQSKILVNLTITFPIALVSATLLSIRFATSLISVVVFFVIPLIFCFLTAAWGMFLDIKMCKYEWASETALVKQSSNSVVGLLGTPLLAIVPILLIFSSINATVVSFVAAIFYVCAAIFFYRRLCSAVIPE